jgi:hypothetical protein
MRMGKCRDFKLEQKRSPVCIPALVLPTGVVGIATELCFLLTLERSARIMVLASTRCRGSLMFVD